MVQLSGCFMRSTIADAKARCLFALEGSEDISKDLSTYDGTT